MKTWSIKETAEYLQLSPQAIENWLCGGHFPGAYRDTQGWHFPQKDVEKVKRRMEEIEEQGDASPPDNDDDGEESLLLLLAVQQGMNSVLTGRVVMGEIVDDQVKKWIAEDNLFLNDGTP